MSEQEAPANDSVVMVAWSAQPETLWGELKLEVSRAVRSFFPSEPKPRPEILRQLLSETDYKQMKVAYARGEVGDIERLLEFAAEQQARHVLILPLALLVDEESGTPADWEAIARQVAHWEQRFPEQELIYLGLSQQQEKIDLILSMLGVEDSKDKALFEATVARGFGGDWDLFTRFMQKFQEGLPDGTEIILRGSAVQGYSYETGAPFDAKGPNTSDLDIVLIGGDAMKLWMDDAFYIVEVNTKPLGDKLPDIAPDLNPLREELQAMVGRPVNIQAMAKWFLDLRSRVQGTPYVALA